MRAVIYSCIDKIHPFEVAKVLMVVESVPGTWVMELIRNDSFILLVNILTFSFRLLIIFIPLIS